MTADATRSAWEEYANRRHMHSHTRWPSKDFLAGFKAGQVAALTDAADAIDGSDKTQVSYRCVAQDLRRRAVEIAGEDDARAALNTTTSQES